jgi:hypothetical protein
MGVPPSKRPTVHVRYCHYAPITPRSNSGFLDRGQAHAGRRIELSLALTNREFLFRHESQGKPLARGFDINRIYGVTELSRYDVSRCVLSRQLAKLQELFGGPLPAHKLWNTQSDLRSRRSPGRGLIQGDRPNRGFRTSDAEKSQFHASTPIGRKEGHSARMAA